MNIKFSHKFAAMVLLAIPSYLALAAVLISLLLQSAHAETPPINKDYTIWRDLPALRDPAPLPNLHNNSPQPQNIVLRWNGKHNSNLLLARLAKHLRTAFPKATITDSHSINPRLSYVPEHIQQAREAIQGILALSPTVVIAATADCRICAGWLAVEQVLLEEKGVPTITIITQPFYKTFQAVRQNMRMDEMSCVIVPHPVANISSEKVYAKADFAAAEVLRILSAR